MKPPLPPCGGFLGGQTWVQGGSKGGFQGGHTQVQGDQKPGFRVAWHLGVADLKPPRAGVALFALRPPYFQRLPPLKPPWGHDFRPRQPRACLLVLACSCLRVLACSCLLACACLLVLACACLLARARLLVLARACLLVLACSCLQPCSPAALGLFATELAGIERQALPGAGGVATGIGVVRPSSKESICGIH